MRPGLTIGEFAQVTHLSVRTLRRYHERGLLEPAVVDPDSGYRYYTSEQIPAAQVIHRLRELDMPLREVREVLATPDPGARASLVAPHLSRLESGLDRTRLAVTSLRRLLQPEPEQFDVELRSVPPMTVAAIGEAVDQARVLGWYHAAMAELDTALAGRRVTGPPGGRYANELFTDGCGNVLVYRPIAEPVGAENCVISCDLGIFADLAAEPVPAQYPDAGAPSRWIHAPGGRVLLQRPVRSVAVVVIGVLTQDQPQVPLAGDQHPVQALAAGTGDPPFGDRVRAWRLDRGLDDRHADGGEHRVGRGGELGVPVMYQKLQAVSLFCEVHEQVAGLLGHPRAGGAGSDAGQVHPGGCRAR